MRLHRTQMRLLLMLDIYMRAEQMDYCATRELAFLLAKLAYIYGVPVFIFWLLLHIYIVKLVYI